MDANFTLSDGNLELDADNDFNVARVVKKHQIKCLSGGSLVRWDSKVKNG
jgi:hypothetical protein